LDVLPAALEALVLLLAEVKGTAAVFAMFPAEFGALAAGLGLAAVPGGGGKNVGKLTIRQGILIIRPVRVI
jgi:hypothetical protein